MRSRCDRLREEALTHGSDSPSSRVWRIHARSCPKCRTEIFVLETLEDQALSERRHLGRKEVAELLAEARRQHGARPGRRFAGGLAWSLRFACLVAICTGAAYLLYMGPGAGHPREQDLTAALSLPDANGGNYSVPLLSPAAEHEAAIREILSSQSGEPAGRPNIRSLDQRVRRLRRAVERRREALLELLERDLGEQMRQDVLDASGSSAMLLA